MPPDCLSPEMDTTQYIDLELRKERLLLQINTQREQLSSYGGYLVKPFAAADIAVGAAQYIKHRPFIAGLVVLAVSVLKRRSLVRWAGWGWTAWRGWRFASHWLQRTGF